MALTLRELSILLSAGLVIGCTYAIGLETARDILSNYSALMSKYESEKNDQQLFLSWHYLQKPAIKDAFRKTLRDYIEEKREKSEEKRYSVKEFYPSLNSHSPVSPFQKSYPLSMQHSFS